MSNPDPRHPENLRLARSETIPYLPGLPPVAGQDLCARFDGGRLSSDDGQQLALFNADYDATCFQLIHIFEATTRHHQTVTAITACT